MAFNFNWSPLAADASFYQRARDLLTTALNKSPKPPIIVDDIIVTEFNLGSVPPDLEILEIGDIAADRFRGIFKMCYAGDAFLTLKTRVQVSFCVAAPFSSTVFLFSSSPPLPLVPHALQVPLWDADWKWARAAVKITLRDKARFLSSFGGPWLHALAPLAASLLAAVLCGPGSARWIVTISARLLLYSRHFRVSLFRFASSYIPEAPRLPRKTRDMFFVA